VVHRAFDAHLDLVGERGAVVLNLPLPRGTALPTAFRIEDPDMIARTAERDPIAAALSLVPAAEVQSQNDWPDRLASEMADSSADLLRFWARVNGLAPETLSRRFRKAFGVTPAAYRAELRAHRAFELIREGNVPLAAIAADCGFADQPHLTRAIKRLTGHSPGSWRRRSIPFKTDED
jgi:AraC-like DNA-binding protein